MPDQPVISSVSMANTKKELLQAYQEAKQRLKALDKNLLDSERTRKDLEKKLAAAAADSQAAQDPLQRLNDLRGAIGRELIDLAEKLETEIEAYRKVQEAVATKQEELKTIYEVETEAADLAALIDAHRVEKQQFEDEMTARRGAFEEEMADARSQWEKEELEHDLQVKEDAEAIKKRRAREREEYEYGFAREKAQRTNELNDKLSTLEKEIAQKRQEFEQESQQRKSDLDAREATLKKNEEEVASLRMESEGFASRVESAVKKATDETAQRLTREFEKDKALLVAKFEGEKNVLTGKIESLEQTIATQSAQIGDLSKNHERAYEKVQDIANRAVEAAKREIYTIPTHPASSSRDEKATD